MSVVFIRNLLYLMRLHKPIGILLLLWPTLWALWVAGKGHPPLLMIIVFILGVILMRSAGCVINDYFDRNFDGHVARTRHRPIVTGEVSPKQALILFGVLCLLASSLLLALPLKAAFLAIPAVLITILYPCMKRYTNLPQLVMGVAFSWGIPMVFVAISGHFSWEGWVLFGVNCIWAVAYDTIYAMVDREDDLKIGVKSTAVLFGQKDTLIIGLLHCSMLIFLSLLGYFLKLGWCYGISLGVAALIMGYQQYLIRNRLPDQCFKAFRISHWVGGVVWIGIVLSLIFH